MYLLVRIHTFLIYFTFTLYLFKAGTMAKSSIEVASSSYNGKGKDRKRKRDRCPSASSLDSIEDSAVKRTGSSQSGDSTRSQEIRPGSLMEALMESKEKEKSDSPHRKKSKKKKKKKEEDGKNKGSAQEPGKEKKSEAATGAKRVLEPATIVGAATDELDLTLRKEDLEENYDTDEEEEAEEHRKSCESQRVVRVERRTMEYGGEKGWNHESVLAQFEHDVREDIAWKKEGQERVQPLHTPSLHTGCKCARPPSRDGAESGSSSSASEGEGSEDSDDADKRAQRDKRRRASVRKRNKRRKTKQSEAAVALVKQEVDWRRHHPCALSSEIVFNVPDMLNESPACRCSVDRKEEGMRHNYYLGERKLETDVGSCSISSLHHYILAVRPSPSDQLKRKTEMRIDGHGCPFHFTGFSLLAHRRLPSVLPLEPQHKWTDEYRFSLEEDERLSEKTVGSIRALDSLFAYITDDILELFDLRRWPEEVERERRYRWSRGERGSRDQEEREDGCPIFHVMPRFERIREDGSFELAPLSAVLEYIRESYGRPFCSRELSGMIHMDARAWDAFTEVEKEGLVIDATKRPSSLRIDLIDRTEYLQGEGEGLPVITHHAWRPSSFILASRPDYQAAASRVAEMKAQLVASLEPEGTRLNPNEEKELRSQIASAETRLQKMKNDCMNRREVPISLSSKNFRRTGFKADLAQQTILLVMMMNHVRFHWAIEILEERISYKFKNRELIELALSHPSYAANYGTNPDHARNAINLCGIRHLGTKSRQHLDGPRLQPEILDLKKGRNRKKDLDRLVELMEHMPGVKKLQLNPGTHNERLEFLGDSVVEMIVTVHLFFLLPQHDEGALATFRSALVQNRNLAALAQEIFLDKLMLMSHGVELLHEPEYRHATANSFEAFMAAVYLDTGKNMDHCERIYGEAMFGREPEMLKLWTNLFDHPLKAEIPGTDRGEIPKAEVLKNLVEFEDSIGVKFAHIRVLYRALTRASGAVNNLNKGTHQSLELLGDTILQMATTHFLYKRFPLLHEGHLSLLRTCLVSNKTQSVICDDLEIGKYVVDAPRRNHAKRELKMKDKADLVEALLGAIYVDRGWEYCKAFTRVCFFPRMKFFIDSHAWADPKSALQQLCLALPRAEKGEKGHRLMPEYKVVAEHGPTNTREYRIACVFRGKKIAEVTASNVHTAQMKAAQEGMQNLPKFFPVEWARHEAKLLRQRSQREPINKGGGGADSAPYPPGASSSSFSPYMTPPPPSGPSPHYHRPPYPPPPHPSPFGYQQQPWQGQQWGCPPLPPPPPPHPSCLHPHYPLPPHPPHSSRPMGLMSLALPPPQGEEPNRKKERREDRKRIRDESRDRNDAAPPPLKSTPSSSSHRPSTPLPPPPPTHRGCPIRASGGCSIVATPPSQAPPPPSQLGYSEWVTPSRSRPVDSYRIPQRAPSFTPSNGSYGPRSGTNSPYSPALNGNQYYHRGPPNGGARIGPPFPPMTNRPIPPKPKSILDVSFKEMWGQ